MSNNFIIEGSSLEIDTVDFLECLLCQPHHFLYFNLVRSQRIDMPCDPPIKNLNWSYSSSSRNKPNKTANVQLRCYCVAQGLAFCTWTLIIQANSYNAVIRISDTRLRSSTSAYSQRTFSRPNLCFPRYLTNGRYLYSSSHKFMLRHVMSNIPLFRG